MRAIILILSLFFLLFGCSMDTEHTWDVQVTYINGEKDTLQITGISNPRIERGGCMYTRTGRTWICGVRRIVILKQH